MFFTQSAANNKQSECTQIATSSVRYLHGKKYDRILGAVL